MLQHAILTVCFALLIGAPQGLLPQTAGPRIGTQQVVAALSASGIMVDLGQVELPSPVPSRSLNPALAVSTLMTMDAYHSKVKLRCQGPGECLPFYAMVTWPTEGDSASARERFSNSRPRSEAAHPRVREPFLVRVGDPATLVLEGRNVRIQLPVICLSNGSAGRSIRVTTADRKRIYRAEVVAAGVLKGGL
jgi:hypothetical protein